jgi:hypothetical protein
LLVRLVVAVAVAAAAAVVVMVVAATAGAAAAGAAAAAAAVVVEVVTPTLLTKQHQCREGCNCIEIPNGSVNLRHWTQRDAAGGCSH